MRTIRETGQFRRDRKRERSGQHGPKLKELLRDVLELLVVDARLPERYRDHLMIGPWAGHRDCHIKPDLVLIYRKPDATTVELVRLGSHSQLGL
jgi:mRNA interferase YafQ